MGYTSFFHCITIFFVHTLPLTIYLSSNLVHSHLSTLASADPELWPLLLCCCEKYVAHLQVHEKNLGTPAQPNVCLNPGDIFILTFCLKCQYSAGAGDAFG